MKGVFEGMSNDGLNDAICERIGIRSYNKPDFLQPGAIFRLLGGSRWQCGSYGTVPDKFWCEIQDESRKEAETLERVMAIAWLYQHDSQQRYLEGGEPE